MSESVLVFSYEKTTFRFYPDGTYKCDNPGYSGGPSQWRIMGDQLQYSHITMIDTWYNWDSKKPDQIGHEECIRLIQAWREGIDGIILGDN